MKRILISLALAVFMLHAYSQKKKETSKEDKNLVVPEVVKKVFAAKFPTAKEIEWSLEKEGEYEAEFEFNKSDMSILYDEKGTLLEIETEIKEADLPQAVKATLAKDFAGYKIKEIEKTETKGTITYEMEAKKDGKEYELVFDSNGKLLKKEEEKEDAENKD